VLGVEIDRYVRRRLAGTWESEPCGFAGLHPCRVAPLLCAIKLSNEVKYDRLMSSLLGLPAPTMTDPRGGEGVRRSADRHFALMTILKRMARMATIGVMTEAVKRRSGCDHFFCCRFDAGAKITRSHECLLRWCCDAAFWPANSRC
jgi:hypothetical protein